MSDGDEEREASNRQQQQARARRFTALYGLSVETSAHEFVDTLADVAALLGEHAPLEDERDDWRCVRDALQGCLERR